MEPEGILPYSQEPSISPCPESDQSSPYRPTLSLHDATAYVLVFLVASFLLVFLTHILQAFLSSPVRATCPTHLILLDVIILIIFDKDYKLCSYYAYTKSMEDCSIYVYNVRTIFNAVVVSDRIFLFSNMFEPCRPSSEYSIFLQAKLY
jgi:hypothetical protein